ncbi:MAG: hypothetical protein VX314_00715, partial [Pseudomonadota bacterium]|nr:hypothetical protein [Pseudomonadota bacterium]
MSNPRFIPERYCTFSPQLAATVGLEEAVLLQGLSHQLAADAHTISVEALAQDFPFWDHVRIGQLLQRIVDLGILDARPCHDPLIWRVTDRPAEAAPKAEPLRAWTPSEHLIDLLNLNHGLT